MKKVKGKLVLSVIIIVFLIIWISNKSIAQERSLARVTYTVQPNACIGTNEVVVSQGRVIEFTFAEAQLLLKVAQAEAGNQGVDGMWLVMSVVVNRVSSDEFPGSVEEVIYQPHQFSTVSNGTIDTVEISPECHEALARIECGAVAAEIVAFETIDSQTLDKYFNVAFTYRNHQFYTSKSK